MRWGALMNKAPTNDKVEEMNKIFPANGKWHTVFEEKDQVHIDSILGRTLDVRHVVQSGQANGPAFFEPVLTVRDDVTLCATKHHCCLLLSRLALSASLATCQRHSHVYLKLIQVLVEVVKVYIRLRTAQGSTQQ